MELAVNLVWLLMAAALVVRLAGDPRAVRLGMREWLAVLCVIVLLFPVVSMSDDMVLANACTEPGRQDLIAHLLPLGLGSDQVNSVAFSETAATLFTGMAFNSRFGVFDFSPQLTMCQWSPRVEKRPPPFRVSRELV